MQHQEIETGDFLPSNPFLPTGLYSPHQVNRLNAQGTITAILTFSADTMRREKLVNTACELGHVWLQDIEDEDDRSDFWKHLRNVIADLKDVTKEIYRKLSGDSPPIAFLTLESASETVPNPESRVTLSTTRDRLNSNRARLDWRLSEIDRHSVRRAYELMGQEIGRSGLGRLKITLDDDDRKWSFWGQAHHMGTTRMHVDPKKGVVNQNCQVHGISNLFMAGSSVFPTSGSATPTFTIVALATKLADHVKRLMT